MRPRVGHIVWFNIATWEEGPVTNYAAIITRLAPGGLVDLTVFDPNTDPYSKRNIAYEASGTVSNTWRWPVDESEHPYR